MPLLIEINYFLNIGYKYGNNATIYFDSLSLTDSQRGLELQQMYILGIYFIIYICVYYLYVI